MLWTRINTSCCFSHSQNQGLRVGKGTCTLSLINLLTKKKKNYGLELQALLIIGLSASESNSSTALKVKTAIWSFGDPWVTGWTGLLTIITNGKLLLYN